MTDMNGRGRRRAAAVTLQALLTALAVLGVAACGGSREDGRATETGSTGTRKEAAADSASMIERGRYVVTIGGCNDCHTPLEMGPNGPAPDMSRMLSGHPESLEMPEPPALGDGPWNWAGAATLTAFAGPWGVSYATNLTPDDTGLGIMSEELFVQAMRTGKHFGQGRPIMPPMPWQNLAQMTDEDLRSIYAYLKTIPPIRNVVPEYQPPPGAVRQ